jgi:predicted amidohydrolase YtcJ
VPALFPTHTYYWGDWHREVVFGEPRASNISPAQWTLQRDMRFTIDHDSPVTLPDSMRVMWTAVNRVTRSGQVLGPGQRIDPLTALKASTLWAAWQYGEEKQKGSIEPGKLADLAILSANPLKVDRMEIQDIQVLETIKEGKTVYQRAAHRRTAGAR